jgi:glycosyltransferase involved in cell wall biosynthesis
VTEEAGNADVTVVIPCFDAGALVREAVDSALGQDGGPPLVLVVDDGSRDPGTLRALEELPAAAEVVKRPNGGLSAARNTGVEHSSTPLLVMLDADDRLHPAALRRLRPELEADPRAGFAYGQAEFFGDWGGVLSLPDWDPYRMLYRSLVSATGLMRRELFDDAGGFDPELPGYEDWDFFLGAVERGWRGVRIPEVTFFYRRSAGTLFGATRADYRRHYRHIRRKHAALFARSGELAKESDIGPVGRLAYRTWFAWRPLPAALEQRLYGLLFRRSRAASTTSASRRAIDG